VQGTGAVDVGRIGPVVEQHAEIDERLTERGHVPVEDALDPIRVGRVELAVVDLVVVVQHGHPRRHGGHRGRQSVGHHGHLRHPSGVDEVPSLAPPGDLPLDEPVGLAEVAEADGDRVEQVQVGERVHDGEPDASGDVVVVGHLGRHVVPDHHAVAVLDDEEVGADHVVVVTERVGVGGAVEVAGQRVDGAELAAHVVGTWREAAERRAAHDQLGVPDAHEVGQVGRAVGELQHAERPVEVGDVGAQVGIEARPVEVLAGAHRPDLELVAASAALLSHRW
jgi:hypothetical protein